VTELAPGTPPLPAHFPFRNRVISALSHAVLVVEARERSGSLVTARHAAEQSVEVHAIPGPLGAPTSAGTNRLLHDGAHVALEPDDLLRPLGLADAVPARAAPPAAAAARGGSAARIVACLADAPASPDELAARLGLAPAALAPHLLELELAGEVSADRDGRLRLVPPRGGLCSRLLQGGACLACGRRLACASWAPASRAARPPGSSRAAASRSRSSR